MDRGGPARHDCQEGPPDYLVSNIGITVAAHCVEARDGR